MRAHRAPRSRLTDVRRAQGGCHGRQNTSADYRGGGAHRRLPARRAARGVRPERPGYPAGRWPAGPYRRPDRFRRRASAFDEQDVVVDLANNPAGNLTWDLAYRNNIPAIYNGLRA